MAITAAASKTVAPTQPLRSSPVNSPSSRASSSASLSPSNSSSSSRSGPAEQALLLRQLGAVFLLRADLHLLVKQNVVGRDLVTQSATLAAFLNKIRANPLVYESKSTSTTKSSCAS